MKFSKDTINILQNFNKINQSLLFLEGNIQKTIGDKSTAIYAEVELEESFPREFGIFDTGQLLSVISLFKEPEIDCAENSMIISEGRHKATYHYASPALIIYPPKGKSLNTGDTINSFELTSEDINVLFKALNIYGHDSLAFIADGHEIVVKTQNSKEKESHGMSHEIGKTDQRFKYVIDISNFLIIPDDYDVVITNTKKFVFTSKTKKLLKYVIAAQAV